MHFLTPDMELQCCILLQGSSENIYEMREISYNFSKPWQVNTEKKHI